MLDPKSSEAVQKNEKYSRGELAVLNFQSITPEWLEFILRQCL